MREDYHEFPTTDMDLPCNTCDLIDACAQEDKECSAFRKWSRFGTYPEDTVGKHVRKIKV